MRSLRCLALALLMILIPGVAWADMPPWLTCGGCRDGGVHGWGVVVWLLLIALMAYRWARRRKR